VAYVKCGLYKKKQKTTTQTLEHGLSSVQKMIRHWT